jgi:hypothetical protein
MARYLSVLRRRTGLVDVVLQARPGAASYNFRVAANWDSAMTLFQVVPAAGYRSRSAPEDSLAGSAFRGKTRFLFNPSDYTVAVPAMDDTKPFYLSIVQNNVDGTSNAAEAQHLVLPYSPAPNRPLVLRGTAPAAADMTGSFEIQLPMQCRNARFQVDGAADAFVAFEPSGPEIRVPALSVEFSNVDMTYPAFTQLFVRGTSATVIGIQAEIRNNPVL